MREIEMGRELEDGKAAKLALFESEQRFRGSMEHAAIGMALVSLDGTFLEVNLALANFLGYEREALMQRTFQDVTYPDDLALDLHECERLLAGEIDEYRLEKRYITSDNRVVWGMLAVTLVRSADGKPLHFVSQTENVTEVHRLADELRKDKEVLLASARELQKAHDDAEAANRAKSEFLAIMSHELRSPLTGVLGFAQLLQMPAFGELNAKQREYVEHIISCGQLELDLLNDILELSNVEAGRVGLEMKAVDPVMVLRSALSNASHAANAQGVMLQQDTSTLVSPPVLADPVRLAQVLNNLLSNAIKYNREGGSVAPHLTADDAGVTITITDNG
ncbi:MAG: PAS domain S-box protein, partial [Usitatibacteraceae bacterium]